MSVSMNELGRAVRYVRRNSRHLGGMRCGSRLGDVEAAAADSSSGGTMAAVNILATLAPLGYAIYKDRKDAKDLKKATKADAMMMAVQQAEALKLAQAQQAAAEAAERQAAIESQKTSAAASQWIGIAAAVGAVLAITVVGVKLFGGQSSKKGA